MTQPDMARQEQEQTEDGQSCVAVVFDRIIKTYVVALSCCIASVRLAMLFCS